MQGDGRAIPKKDRMQRVGREKLVNHPQSKNHDDPNEDETTMMKRSMKFDNLLTMNEWQPTTTPHLDVVSSSSPPPPVLFRLDDDEEEDDASSWSSSSWSSSSWSSSSSSWSSCHSAVAASADSSSLSFSSNSSNNDCFPHSSSLLVSRFVQLNHHNNDRSDAAATSSCLLVKNPATAALALLAGGRIEKTVVDRIRRQRFVSHPSHDRNAHGGRDCAITTPHHKTT
jgi:hypothetical protein